MFFPRIAFSFLALALVAAGAAHAGNKQLMSEKMAVQDLKRNIVEAVVGFKVKSEGRFGLTEDAAYKVDSKAASVVKGVIVDKRIYDKKKDIALAFGHIDLGDVVNVLGDRLHFKDVRVESFGFGTMTPSSRPPLAALRAALLNAYEQLATMLVGERILSMSSAENFLLTKDVNRSKVCAAVFGAYIPNPALNSPNRGWGWDETGNAFVKLEIDARQVRDMLGNLVKYKGPNIIEVTGRGAMEDDITPMLEKEGAASMIKKNTDKTRYMDLDVPLGGPSNGEEQ